MGAQTSQQKGHVQQRKHPTITNAPGRAGKSTWYPYPNRYDFGCRLRSPVP